MLTEVIDTLSHKLLNGNEPTTSIEHCSLSLDWFCTSLLGCTKKKTERILIPSPSPGYILLFFALA